MLTGLSLVANIILFAAVIVSKIKNKSLNNEINRAYDDSAYAFDEAIHLRDENQKLRQELIDKRQELIDTRQDLIDTLEANMELGEQNYAIHEYLKEQREIVEANLQVLRDELDGAYATIDEYVEAYEPVVEPVIIDGNCKVKEDIPLLMAPVVEVEPVEEVKEEPVKVKERFEFKFISNAKPIKKTIISKIVIEDLFDESLENNFKKFAKSEINSETSI